MKSDIDQKYSAVETKVEALERQQLSWEQAHRKSKRESSNNEELIEEEVNVSEEDFKIKFTLPPTKWPKSFEALSPLI